MSYRKKAKKSILFVVPYPIGFAPGQRFRFELLLQYLQDSFQIKVSPLLGIESYHILYAKSEIHRKIWALVVGFIRRTKLIFSVLKYDYVFVFREVFFFGPPIFEWFIAKVLKKKIIYDFDDAIWLPDQNRESTVWRWLKWRSKIASICKWSWKVSVGNEYLADFASEYNTNVVLIPTVVDAEVHKPISSVKNQKPIVGWTGSHSTLQYLDMIIPSLQKLEKEMDFTFRVIANKDPRLPLKNYSFLPWNKKAEIEDLATIDIGVMPLPDDEWAKGKCGFKLIQYLALEIPAVASPVGVNTDIIQHGQTGFLARTTEEWAESLKKLLQNQSIRAEMGKKGRALIEKKYSVQSQVEAFQSLFSKRN